MLEQTNMEFFRHCPGCGKRFHIVLVEKKQVEEHDTSGGSGPMVPGIGRIGVSDQVVRTLPYLAEGSPNIFDVKEFQYKYKCKHCDHEWTETKLRDQRVGRANDSRIGVDEEGELD